jgi:plasmid stabilization system protein ParE
VGRRHLRSGGALKEFPYSGLGVEEARRNEIREVIYGGCRIIHRVEAERVLVLTVRHQRQSVDETEVGDL